MKKTTTLVTMGAMALSIAGGISVWSGRGQAADHLDPPARTDPTAGGMDRAADIADVYTWHRGTGATQSLVTIMSFAGPNERVAGQRMPCDRDVLYSLHFDNNNDGAAEITISARMAQDAQMNCFVQWSGIPGTSAPITTPAEYTRSVGSVRLYAGLRDDAFFFDLQGFRETLMVAANPATMAGVDPMTGGIRMVSDRDFFAGKNTSALVIEQPLTPVLGTGTAIRVWGTTARITM